MTFLLLVAPVAGFDSDLAPFLEKKIPSDPEAAVPVVKPVDPSAPFPKLPPVETMLNGSAHTVSAIVEEVTKIQARVHNVEQQDQTKLAQKKAEFEGQLKGQEEETRSVIAENAQIAARITALQKGNQGLRDTSKELQAENQGMRAELRSANTKVSAAGDFIKASEKTTDDRHAKVLAILSEGLRHGRRQMPVSTDNQDVAENQEGGDNEDAASSNADSNDVADSAQKAASAEEKPKAFVGIFGHRSKASRQATHEAKDSEKKKEDDDDDDDSDDDKEDDKDDGPESFMQYKSRRAHMEESESEEAEASDSDEARTDTSDFALPVFSSHRHGFHHKGKQSSDIVVDGASKSMLAEVSQELQKLAAEDEQGLERQTQMFHSELADEQHAYKAALAQQHALNKTEASLLKEQSKLRRAVGHLQETKGHLQQRVRGLGQYLQHLAHLLLAPDKEAGGLIDSMDVPVPVAMPPQNPAPAVTQPVSMLSTGALFRPLYPQAVKK